MTWLGPLVALFALGMLQVFLAQVWTALGLIDWLLIYLVLETLRGSFRRAILLGATAGLIQDGLSGGMIGLHAFAKTSVAALIATFGGFMVVRGPIPEALVTGVATLMEGLLVVAWQALLERPVSLGPTEMVARAAATALATLAVLMAARRWEQRKLRRRFGGRR